MPGARHNKLCGKAHTRHREHTSALVLASVLKDAPISPSFQCFCVVRELPLVVGCCQAARRSAGQRGRRSASEAAEAMARSETDEAKIKAAQVRRIQTGGGSSTGTILTGPNKKTRCFANYPITLVSKKQ